jgi:Chain length determinant protein
MLTSPETSAASRPSLDDADRLIEGVFEPPKSPVLSAITRHKWMVCAAAVLLALLGAGYGRSRPRTYTASATLQVGQVNPNSPGFYGYVQSATSLATAFSRGIDAQPVLDGIQHRLRLSPSLAVARLSAEPIPASPVFRVIATGPTKLAAIELTNVAAESLISYEQQSNSSNPEAASLLHEYQQAALELRRADAGVAGLSRAKSGYSSALAAAEAQRNVDQVRLRAIATAYTSAVSNRAPSSGLISVLAGAAGASNDHSAKIQKFAFIGLLAGIVMGSLTAVLFERWRTRRRAAGRLTAETQTSPPVR